MANEQVLTRPTRVGVVVSNKMDKTVVVAVETPSRHPRYQKYIRRTKKFMVHDERNECQVGDKVLIVQDRPRSKNKSWRLREIILRSIRPDEAAVLQAERPELEVEKEQSTEEE